MNAMKKHWLLFTIVLTLCSATASAQPSFGVLYFSSNVSDEYWTQDLAHDIAHMLLSELAPLGIVQPLEREHILLLMKEIDPPKVDNLEGNVIQEIRKLKFQ